MAEYCIGYWFTCSNYMKVEASSAEEALNIAYKKFDTDLNLRIVDWDASAELIEDQPMD